MFDDFLLLYFSSFCSGISVWVAREEGIFSWWHVRKRTNHWFSVTTAKCKISGPSVHLETRQASVSHWNIWTLGLGFSVPTEHHWWILFITHIFSVISTTLLHRNLPSGHMTFIQRRINADVSSWRLLNITLKSMHRNDLYITSHKRQCKRHEVYTTLHSVHLGPVVQSVVILTSSLRVISLTVLADSIHNILKFFAEKMWVAFALQKLLKFFQQNISAYLRITRCKF